MVVSRRSHPEPSYVDFFMIQLDDFKIFCSQIGGLMGNAHGNMPPTPLQIKKLFGILGRDYGEMSEAMKYNAREILTKAILYDPNKPAGSILSEMIVTYAYKMYGKGEVSKGNQSPLHLEKASMAEPEAIKFLSKIDGVDYAKNTEIFENKWFRGIPYVLVRTENGKIEKIIEIKTSYDLPSFILTKLKPEKKSNIYEVLGYMDVTGCKKAEIVHILVDMPEKIASFEEKRLRERYELLEIAPDLITERILQRMNDMEYSEIPDELKYFRRPVAHNKYTIKSVKSRVTISKKWITDIHESFTQNLVNLSETYSEDQESNV